MLLEGFALQGLTGQLLGSEPAISVFGLKVLVGSGIALIYPALILFRVGGTYLLAMIHDSFMSRPNCIVVPGGKMEMAIQLVVTPLLHGIMERRKSALRAEGAY